MIICFALISSAVGIGDSCRISPEYLYPDNGAKINSAVVGYLNSAVSAKPGRVIHNKACFGNSAVHSKYFKSTVCTTFVACNDEAYLIIAGCTVTMNGILKIGIVWIACLCIRVAKIPLISKWQHITFIRITAVVKLCKGISQANCRGNKIHFWVRI